MSHDSYDIYYQDYGIDQMDFFYTKCLEYLQQVTDMSLTSTWMSIQFHKFQGKCVVLSTQLEGAKLTEDGLNKWHNDLFDAYRQFKTDTNKTTPEFEGDYQVLLQLNDSLQMCKKVIKEMLRILNPEQKKYKVWFAWPDREKFLRDIGFLSTSSVKPIVDIQTLLTHMEKLNS